MAVQNKQSRNAAIDKWKLRLLQLSLWQRLALASGLGFLAIALIMIVVGEWALNTNTDHLLNERVTIVMMAAGQIDQTIQQAVDDLTQASLVMDLSTQSLTNQSEMTMLHVLGQNTLFTEGVLLADDTGLLVDTYPPEIYSFMAASELPFIATGLEKPETSISEPFIGPGNNPVTAVTVPLFKGGRFYGLLIGLINLTSSEFTNPLFTAKRVGETGHATLIDSNGFTLASTLDIPLINTNEHPGFYCEAMLKEEPSIGVTPFALQDVVGEQYGENHVMAVAPLSLVPWGVAVGGDEDETFAGVQQLRQGMIAISGVALILIAAITLYSARKITYPIQQLTLAANQIDGGDLNTPLSVPGSGEVGILSSTLENMRTKLVENLRSLETWNDTLETKVDEQTQEIQAQKARIQALLQHTLTAQEIERSRISHELHDEIGQYLTAIEFSLERIIRTLSTENEQIEAAVEQTRLLLQKTITSLREIITDMRPGVLDELGLVPALRWMGKHVLNPVGMQMKVDENEINPRLSGAVETVLFRITQEAINNAIRHSGADLFTVSLSQTEGTFGMELADNGQGFDVTAVSPNPDENHGFGLPGMQERASAVGGKVTIVSSPGNGTTITVIVPLHNQNEHRGIL